MCGCPGRRDNSRRYARGKAAAPGRQRDYASKLEAIVKSFVGAVRRRGGRKMARAKSMKRRALLMKRPLDRRVARRREISVMAVQWRSRSVLSSFKGCSSCYPAVESRSDRVRECDELAALRFAKRSVSERRKAMYKPVLAHVTMLDEALTPASAGLP